MFVRAARGEFDCVLACYHDQGLMPVKLLAFGTAVNVTLGLPIMRTSVDHGTAFDIAGQGVADPGSMIEAVCWRPSWPARGGHAVSTRGADAEAGRPRDEERRRDADRRQPQGASRLPHPRDLRGRRALLGTEVKGIREGKANLRDSYARVEKGEVWLYNVHINPYSHRGYVDHDPKRRRKLLLHKLRRSAS